MVMSQGISGTRANIQGSITLRDTNRSVRFFAHQSAPFANTRVSGTDADVVTSELDTVVNLTISDSARRLLRIMGVNTLRDVSNVQMWQNLIDDKQTTELTSIISQEAITGEYAFASMPSQRHPQGTTEILFNILKNELTLDVAQEISTELASLIDAYQNNPNASLEERAMQREAALRAAQQVSDTLLSYETAEMFINEVNNRVQNDIRAEQGHALDRNRNFNTNPWGRPDHGMSWRYAYRFDYDDNGNPLNDRVLIPNFAVWAAEQYGMSMSELEDIMFAGLRSLRRAGGNVQMLLDCTDFNRFREVVFRKFADMADEANFGAIEDDWLSRRHAEFNENAEQIYADITATRQAFVTLIKQQQFSSTQQWHDKMMQLLENLSALQTSIQQDSET